MTNGRRRPRRRIAGHRPAKARLETPSTSGSGVEPTGTPQAAPEQLASQHAGITSGPATPEAAAQQADPKEQQPPSLWSKIATVVVPVAALITSLTAIAAVLFTGFSLQQTQDQTQLAVAGQITDRFNAAVTNLGSSTMTIRIGGIYALQRIMQDSPRDQPAVVQVLAAFVREQATRPAGASASVTPLTFAQLSAVPAIDLQTAVTVLATRNSSHDGTARLDLDTTDLINVDLSGADLTDANFGEAMLVSADLSGANLTRAYLLGSNLSGADLDGANLSDANLEAVNLAGANLTNTNLAGADLDLADLAGANLRGANPTAAKLTDANLWATSWCRGSKPVYAGGYVCSASFR